MNNIIWHKWVDPFLFDDDEDDDEDVDDVDDDRMDSHNKLHGDMNDSHKPRFNGPILVGPMGVIPINEHNQPSKVFNFWMGHTNFNIGKRAINILNHIDGIETLDVYTRYRFRISVGKAFEEEEVLKNIEIALCKQIEPDKVIPLEDKRVGLQKFQDFLNKQYKFWVIFVLPDGQLDYHFGDTQEYIEQVIATYTSQTEQIIKSWEIKNDGKKNGNGHRIQTSAGQ